MKFIYNSLFHSVHCSSMFRSVKILSVNPRPLRIPDCSFRKRSSTAWVMHCIMTLQKILLGTDKRVIPRQLLQSLRDPFFGILIITLLWYLDYHTPMSAPLLALTSRRDLRHFPLINRWSIWFLSLPFGEHHVILWISRCGKRVPPITRLLVVQNSTSLSPFSLMMPLPCLPITLSLPELSAPTLAFRSPMMMIVQLIYINWSDFE